MITFGKQSLAFLFFVMGKTLGLSQSSERLYIGILSIHALIMIIVNTMHCINTIIFVW